MGTRGSRLAGRVGHCALLLLVALLPACRRGVPRETPPPRPAGFFIPPGARNIQQHEQDGIRALTFEVATAYPAGSFLCELTSFLERQHWRGLREDALNAGGSTGLVRGWSELEDAQRESVTRVHAWTATWLNPQGDLLFYSLKYEYPAGAKPDSSTLSVFAQAWPAAFARAQLGPRADQLKTMLIPEMETIVGEAYECAPQPWSDLVTRVSQGTSAAPGLPSELGRVHSILIQHDIDGLAARMAAVLTARVPGLEVATVHDRHSVSPDAYLDFDVECRCNVTGAPNGFYVRESVVYLPGVEHDEWIEPARVLFHWTDAGQPIWRKQVPASCMSQQPLSALCKASFEQSDIAFVDALAETLLRAQDPAANRHAR